MQRVGGKRNRRGGNRRYTRPEARLGRPEELKTKNEKKEGCVLEHSGQREWPGVRSKMGGNQALVL